MTNRDHNPAGAPCWTDLWTSDVEGTRRFYRGVFGWESSDPAEEFGGYFMFLRDGVPVAGCMGDMGDMKADDTWKIYLASDDIERTVSLCAEQGADIVVPAMPVGDAGVQAVLVDPVGAPLGVWQTKDFPGFTVLDEPGSPSWFELHTRDFATSTAFYRQAFGWELEVASDTDELRYSMMRNPEGGDDLAGVMDAASFLPESLPAWWSTYWAVADVDATVEAVTRLGGSVVHPAESTPYGRLAAVADPAGAQFKLRTAPA